MPFPIEEKYIIDTEKELSVLFPIQFKNRMIQLNGGELVSDEFEFELFPFFDTSDNKRISRTSNHIGLETKNARKWHTFPDNGIAIGNDGFGNLILLIHNGDGNLSDDIYFWDHETGQIEKIASSIDELEG